MRFDKQATLVSRLFRSTNDGKLDWKSSPRDDAFQVSFPRYTVTLSKRGSDYYVEIINEAGETADLVSDGQLDKAVDVEAPPVGVSWYQTLQELYIMARRRALGADQALDDLLGELGD